MTQQIYTTPTPFSGTNISIPNSGKGYTSNMVIKGQTYQNLVNDNPYYTGANTSLFHWELSENDSKITIKRTQPGDINWQYVGVPININLLKNDTTYTVIFFASGKCEYVNAYINVMEGSAINSVGGGRVPRISGINKYKFTTDHNTKIQNQILYIGIDRSELPNVNDYMTLSNFLLLEGDWTNKEVPAQVTGIESVGDKENNKISILSHNKNLFFIDKDSIKQNGAELNITINKDEVYYQVGNSWNVGITYKTNRLKPNTSYTLLKQTTEKYNQNVFYMLEYYKNNNKIQTQNIPNGQGYSSTSFTTIAEDFDTCILYFKNNMRNEIEGIYKPVLYETSINNSDYVVPKEDKKEILIGLDGGLKSLPDGTCDTIEQRDDGVYLIQRIGKVVLNGSDNEDWTKVGNATNHTLVYHSFNAKRISVAPYCYPFLNSQLPYSNIKLDNIEKEGCYTAQDGNVCVSISNNKLESPDPDGFKKWLQHNNMIGYYMLEKPIEVKLNSSTLNLQVFKDLTYISSDNSIKPILEFKAPIIGYKTINPIQLKTTQDGTEVNVYPYSTPELITFGDNETLADKMNNIENTHKHNNATVTSDGFMSKESYSKLESLTNYTHPSTHAATMITQDSSHRFITDAERNNWNAKASTNVATSSTNGLMSNTDKQKIDRISNNFDIVYDANTETIRFRFR